MEETNILNNIEELEKRVDGTLFLSEVQAPFWIYKLPINKSLDDFFTDLIGENNSEGCIEHPITFLFKNVTTLPEIDDKAIMENTVRYLDLINYFIENFNDIQVYTLGEEDFNIFLTGKSKQGEIVILYTKAKE